MIKHKKNCLNLFYIYFFETMELGTTLKAFILFVILRLLENWVVDQKLRLKPFVNESITGIKSLNAIPWKIFSKRSANRE